MRKILTILVLSLAFAVQAQVAMRDMLQQMPDTLLPYLKTNARLDFIDFIDSNMKAVVSNSLEGKSELVKLTDVYAKLALTQASQMELRLLDTVEEVDSARQMLCVVSTYGTDVRESTVEFYSVHWRKLSIADRVGVPFGTYVATLGEQEPTLSLHPECILDTPANEEQKELSRPSIILKWDGKRFNEY